MGQPMEHGLKTVYLGLELADALGLSEDDKEAVFYGAFLKDLGCPTHAQRFASFFAGDELAPRRDYFMVNPESMTRMIAWFLRHAAADASLPRRMTKLFSFFADGQP
jgi:hypothetical protein